MPCVWSRGGFAGLVTGNKAAVSPNRRNYEVVCTSSNQLITINHVIIIFKHSVKECIKRTEFPGRNQPRQWTYPYRWTQQKKTPSKPGYWAYRPSMNAVSRPSQTSITWCGTHKQFHLMNRIEYHLIMCVCRRGGGWMGWEWGLLPCFLDASARCYV